jgi:uncharacterized membrane protein
MKAKLLLLLLVASLAGNVAFVTTTLLAHARQGQLPMDRLGVDAGQRARLLTLRRDFVSERERAHARMAVLRDALADEVRKPAPDRQRMLQATAEMTEIQSRMRPRLVAHLLDRHGVLRPEQRALLADMLSKGGAPACPGAALYPASGEAK